MSYINTAPIAMNVFSSSEINDSECDGCKDTCAQSRRTLRTCTAPSQRTCGLSSGRTASLAVQATSVQHTCTVYFNSHFQHEAELAISSLIFFPPLVRTSVSSRNRPSLFISSLISSHCVFLGYPSV